MPDGMEIRVLFVVIKEIRTNRIKRTLCEDPCERRVRHMEPHRVEYQQGDPAHGEVQREGQFRVLAQRNKFPYRAREHARPQEYK